MQHQVNLRGAKKHHDTIRDMMASSSHVFYFISRGGNQWVYGGRLFVVSARTRIGKSLSGHKHDGDCDAL